MKLPKAPHPLGQLTTTELARYISELQGTLDKPRITEAERNTVLADLGKAYEESNSRPVKAPDY